MDISAKKYRVVFTDNAILEMDYIYNYISNNLYALESARRLMRKVEKYAYSLKYMPRANRIIKKISELQLEYRRIIINNYVMIYTIVEEEQSVYIVHIYYKKSNYLNKI